MGGDGAGAGDGFGLAGVDFDVVGDAGVYERSRR
jgi:hypothetical protein